jgi:hypothetical protein
MKSMKTLKAIIAVCALATTVMAQTEHITIGRLSYSAAGVHIYTDTSGVQHPYPVSDYELIFTTGGVTAEPIAFSKATFIVKGTSLSSPAFNTGPFCGWGVPTAPPCDMTQTGAPAFAGYKLAPCAKLDTSATGLI